MRRIETADQITFPSRGKLIKVKLTELSLVIVDSYHDNERKTEAREILSVGRNGGSLVRRKAK